MAHTNSLAFPNMFSASRNMVNVIEDDVSITNRCKLLLQTDPTALYNSPTFGCGLKQFLFQYNTPNTVALIKDRICQQLSEFEPCVIADETVFSDTLLYTGEFSAFNKYTNEQTVEMTVGLKTVYGDVLDIETNNM